LPGEILAQRDRSIGGQKLAPALALEAIVSSARKMRCALSFSINTVCAIPVSLALCVLVKKIALLDLIIYQPSSCRYATPPTGFIYR